VTVQPPFAPPVEPERKRDTRRWLPQLVLLLILAVAAYLRFSGIDWDSGAHLHPDERFLTLVEGSLQPVDSLAAYFDTEHSTLNPNNVGHSFFVYGTLPIFIVRYVADWVGQTGYGEVYLVGRALSATFDMLSVLLVFLIGSHLYRRRVGLLAAAFASVSVLLIQHAHFFVVDPFANTFILAGFYFAVRVLNEGKRWDYAVFGVLFGMAMASKISALPLAGMAVLAAGARYFRAELEARQDAFKQAAIGLTLAAFLSLLTFRIFQPYAFAGPGFFGLRPNPHWLSTLSEIRLQTSGAVDFPPALQWADRIPFWFSLRNMVLWGMGLPLGLTAWAAWGWALLSIIGGRRWDRHLLPVVWVGGYFGWQSSGFTQAMRYQLPVYPILAVLAAWGLWHAWDRAAGLQARWRVWIRPAVAVLATAVLVLSTLWAFAFLHVYTEPMTRVAASRWIYAHVPAAVNVVIQTDAGEELEPVAAPEDFVLYPGQVQDLPFTAHHDGQAKAVLTPLVSSMAAEADPYQLTFQLFEGAPEDLPLGSSRYSGQIPSAGDTRLELDIDPGFQITTGSSYTMRIELGGSASVKMDGAPALVMDTEDGEQLEPTSLPETSVALQPQRPLVLPFDSHHGGRVSGVRLAHLQGQLDRAVRLQVSLQPAGTDESLVTSEENLDPLDMQVPVDIRFEDAPVIEQGGSYQLTVEVLDNLGVTLRGDTIVHETSWDDPLPQRLDGYDIGGRYPSLNQELYWPDDEDKDGNGVSDKLERIVDSLTNGDYLFISSNRQYGSIGRVPSRYPLTTAYYRLLFNCPAPTDIWVCADRAKPGQGHNAIGYELVQVFETNPHLFGVEVSDQGAEESFTVYDHPQVLVFRRTDAYNADELRATLAAVDLSHVQHKAPNELQAGPVRTAQLELPPSRWRAMQNAGTWSKLFPPDGLLNRSQPLAVVVWWLAIAALGWLALPFTRRALPGLVDGGYALARGVGLLIFAWLSWMAGSAGLRIERPTLWLIVLVMAIGSGALAWRDRHQLADLIRHRRREILFVEGMALAFFAFDLLIRLGNPDLWHPSKGGEKPMDLSYLNAVLKSPTFPPFDPWFAGGYINYYYFGFVLVGMPMKLLGIDSAVAYNLAVPTIFSLLALSAYAAASHLVAPVDSERGLGWGGRVAGLAAAVLLVLLGNLGTARMLFEAFQAVGGGSGGGLLADIGRAVRGFYEVLVGGQHLPIALDSWYWNPSRAIPPGPGELAGPITEFPFFTFLYADLHAHMINLPLTVASLTWAVSLLRDAARGLRRGLIETATVLVLGGLLIGALRPTNTWDFPVYLVFGLVAVLAAAWLRTGELTPKTVAAGLASALTLAGLAFLLYQPYSRWYVQGYTQAQLWEGGKTSINAYLTVYGLFLFLIVSWLLWESREWMASTPLVALRRVARWSIYLIMAAIVFVLSVMVADALGYHVFLLAAPLMVWVGLLILRPEQPVGKRIALFLVGTGLALTLVVEVVVLVGDIGRMNTVFKFYLQVWTLFSLASGAALAWTLRDLPRWSTGWRSVWQIGAVGLLAAGALYPLTATPAKIRDRMAVAAPHTLDGSAFMQFASRSELGTRFDLADDYRAIEWLKANAVGSPVIVEASIPEYRWGTRYTIYTGLPSVVGWNWHQRQQRVAIADQVEARVESVSRFYGTTSIEQALDFLRKYDVTYVMVGELERVYFGQIEPCWPAGDQGQGVTCDLAGRALGTLNPTVSAVECDVIDDSGDLAQLSCPTHGLDKFERMREAGDLTLAFESGDTRIYQVVRP
jgi:YYY domain-containing protein